MTIVSSGMVRFTCGRCTALLGALALTAAPSTTAAQSVGEAPAAAPGIGVEEIVVTARKRAEAFVDVPVAVTAWSRQQMEHAGIDDLRDITLRTPGVSYREQAGTIVGRHKTAVRFRGMDTNQPVPSQQVGTVFLDGIYVASGVQSLDLSALERVEVIKGPQSAIFGRSTFGGAINYVTRNPGNEFEGRISADFAQDTTYDVALALEGPILDELLAFRVSLRGFGTDGQYVSQADGGRLGDESTRSANLVLYSEPLDNLSIKFRAFYAEDKDGPADGIFIGSDVANFGAGPALANCNDLDPSRTGVTDYFCGNIDDIIRSRGFDWDALASSNTIVSPAAAAIFGSLLVTETFSGETDPKIDDVPDIAGVGLRRDQTRFALSMDYEIPSGWLDGHAITLIGAYNESRNNFVRDFDSTFTNAWLGQDPQYDEDWTVEGRIDSPQRDRFRYSFGVSYLDTIHEEAPVLDVLVYDPNGTIGAFGIPGPLVFYGNTPEEEGGETIGVFAAVGIDFNEQWSLDLETRWQRDKISQGSSFEGAFYNWLPRITLSYHPVEDATIWATYSEGNLPGFFNPALVGLDAAEIAQIEAQVGAVGLFNDEEELENIELGWKQRLFDGRLFVSAVGYWMDWTNQKTRQGVSFTDSETGQLRVTGVQTNAGNSELYGLELEGSFALTDNLSGSAAFNLAKAEYKDFVCSFSTFAVGHVSGRIPCDGNRSPKFPERSASFALAWQAGLDNGWDYFARLDGIYIGKTYNEEANFSWLGDYWRFNVRGGVEVDSLRVEAYVENLFDDDNAESASRIADFSTAAFTGFATQFGIVIAPPVKRLFGVRAVYNF